MPIIDQNISIELARPSLDNLPSYALPPEYQPTW
jgi:hypothetical protein